MITALTLAPIAAAVLIMALPEARARMVALGGALVSLAITVCMLTRFDLAEKGIQFKEKFSWIPALGIDYFVGLDGLNALVLLLAALLAPLVVLASWKHTDRPRTYFALMCLQFTGLFGVFTALNFFHWFLYWELALVPAFFLIKLFGQGEERHRAALNFFLFTVVGSVAMLLPGVMSKMGVYGFLRLVVPIFPDHLQHYATALMAFALVTILWGAFLALRQTDLKRMVAFSSLNHVAFCVLAVGAIEVVADGTKIDVRALATQGIILQMFAHGIAAAGLFYLVGLLEERGGSRGLGDFGGLSSVTPRLAAAFFMLTFCSLGLPFMAGFAAEFLIFSSSFAVAPGITAVATLGLLATAVFLLTMLQKVFTGPAPERHRAMPDLSLMETLILIPLLILVFWAGMAPATWLRFSANLF